ncbi:MAG TPA: 1,4-dihydroxy-2-naphthoate polyprenyltransferase [Flavobacteriales bacterium]|nr:1,4-dihydroxy-2-naphthoate polyprenyltransferase [Flavobacteriales bacterium]
MKHWLQAFRLRTLPLAVSSIIVGSALAYLAEYIYPVTPPNFRSSVLLLALLTAVLLQILSNLANDLGDHQHGTDNADRVGPQRSVQSGAIKPAQMKRAMIICGVLAFISGCALITVALGFTLKTLIFLLLGLLAIGAAVKYTFGKNPYGYAGLGDISVFLFFGIIGVCGTFFLHERNLHWAVLLPAAAFGLLSAGVLNVNNMRDIANDAASGKRTLVVRIGSTNAKVYQTTLVGSGIVLLVCFAFLMEMPWTGWLFLLVLPGFIIHLRKVWTTTEPRALDPQLKVLAMGTFVTALLFSLGLILAV